MTFSDISGSFRETERTLLYQQWFNQSAERMDWRMIHNPSLERYISTNRIS